MQSCPRTAAVPANLKTRTRAGPLLKSLARAARKGHAGEPPRIYSATTTALRQTHTLERPSRGRGLAGSFGTMNGARR